MWTLLIPTNISGFWLAVHGIRLDRTQLISFSLFRYINGIYLQSVASKLCLALTWKWNPLFLLSLTLCIDKRNEETIPFICMRFFNESQSLEVSVRHYWLKTTWKLGVDQDFKYKIPARNDHSRGNRSGNHLHKNGPHRWKFFNLSDWWCCFTSVDLILNPILNFISFDW